MAEFDYVEPKEEGPLQSLNQLNFKDLEDSKLELPWLS